MLKVVFFDAAGTLIYLPRRVGEHYADVAARFGVLLDASELDHAFRAAWVAAPPRASDRRPRVDDDKGWWRSLVDRVLRKVLPVATSTDFDEDAYFEAVYLHFAAPGVWAVYAEVFEVLEGLRARGFTLGVISNFDRRLYAVFDGLGLTKYFERVVISSEVGADKPDPFIFRSALEAFHVQADEVIHVGDDPRCDWGAESLGMHIFRLERPEGSLKGVIEMIDGPS